MSLSRKLLIPNLVDGMAVLLLDPTRVSCFERGAQAQIWACGPEVGLQMMLLLMTTTMFWKKK